MVCATCEQAPRKKGKRQCGRCAWKSEDKTLARERRKLYKQRLRRRQGCRTREEILAAAIEKKRLRQLERLTPREPRPSRFTPTDTLRKPLHRRAQNLVYIAVRDGRLVRPERCSKCRSKRGTIEASHDDYSKPLQIEWLCASCHHKKDKANPKLHVRSA